MKKPIATEKIIMEPATKNEVKILEKLILFFDVVSKKKVWLCSDLVTNKIPKNPNTYGINAKNKVRLLFSNTVIKFLTSKFDAPAAPIFENIATVKGILPIWVIIKMIIQPIKYLQPSFLTFKTFSINISHFLLNIIVDSLQ